MYSAAHTYNNNNNSLLYLIWHYFMLLLLLLLLFGCVPLPISAVAKRFKSDISWRSIYFTDQACIQFNFWLSIFLLVHLVWAVIASCLHQLYIYSVSFTEWIPWSDSTCEPNQTKQANKRMNESTRAQNITAQPATTTTITETPKHKNKIK